MFESLTDLLAKKDKSVKLKALGALAQLPYFSRRNKALMSCNVRLLDRLIRLMRLDDAWSHEVQQIQMRSCRVLASLCSTPAANPAVCKALAQHPGFVDALVSSLPCSSSRYISPTHAHAPEPPLGLGSPAQMSRF